MGALSTGTDEGAGEGSTIGSGAAMSFDVMVLDRERERDASISIASPSWTSSREEVEIRWAVSNGDFVSDVDTESWGCWQRFVGGESSLVLGLIVEDSALDGLGVVTDSPVNDRTEAEDTGREVVSGASSNVSCSLSELSALDILIPLSAIMAIVVDYNIRGQRKGPKKGCLCSFPDCTYVRPHEPAGLTRPALNTRRTSLSPTLRDHRDLMKCHHI